MKDGITIKRFLTDTSRNGLISLVNNTKLTFCGEFTGIFYVKNIFCDLEIISRF